MDGLFLHMSASQMSKPFSYSCVQAVILPSLRRLHFDLVELDNVKDTTPGKAGMEIICKKSLEGNRGFSNVDLDRKDECGICLFGALCQNGLAELLSCNVHQLLL